MTSILLFLFFRFVYCVVAHIKVDEIVFNYCVEKEDFKYYQIIDYAWYEFIKDTFILTKWKVKDFCNNEEVRKEVFGGH